MEVTLSLREELDAVLREALGQLAPSLGEEDLQRAVFGATKAPEHGDLAANAAMVFCKELGRKPRELGEELAGLLASSPFIASTEVAGPGFVNVRLSNTAFLHALRAIHHEGEEYGEGTLGQNASVLLEFVSANPTGPMHLGHCRHAAVGDVLARLLRAAGYKVTTEFYINDAGAQMAALGDSFRARCLEAAGLPAETAGIQYSGEYLAGFAREFIEGKSAEELTGMDVSDYAWAARERNLRMIQDDLAAMSVFFDSYVSERDLHDSGEVGEAIQALRESGQVYEKDGALFLRTQEFGDDQDRVLIKSDGAPTYLVPDLAYHHDKFKRGFDRYINLFGADHGGYPARLRAGIANMGHEVDRLTILLLRLVFLTREGKRVKFSKRAGNFVAMADVVEEAGNDATRWFMLSRSIDSEFEFDMDLARESTSVNPVFKVQYAHARIRSVERKGREAGFAAAHPAEEIIGRLSAPIEREMILTLAQFPEVILRSARELDVHHMPSYLLQVAELWNRYWSLARTDPDFRILREDDPELTSARLLLAESLRQVLANGLGLMGIAAPRKMVREEEDA